MAGEVVSQGALYWIDRGVPFGSEPGYGRPYVVIQNDAINRSAIGTILACPLTTNLSLARAPGNVLIRKGQGGTPRDSVVNVSQTVVLDRARFVEFLGQLSPRHVRQIVEGVNLIIQPSP
jgi:mRNA interferase MazF